MLCITRISSIKSKITSINHVCGRHIRALYGGNHKINRTYITQTILLYYLPHNTHAFDLHDLHALCSTVY